MCTQGLQSKINAIYHDTSSLAPADEAKWFVKEFSQKFKIDQEAYDAFFLAYDKGPNATTLGVACDFLKNTTHMNRLGWLSEIEKIGPMPDAPTTNSAAAATIILVVVLSSVVVVILLGAGASYGYIWWRGHRSNLTRVQSKMKKMEAAVMAKSKALKDFMSKDTKEEKEIAAITLDPESVKFDIKDESTVIGRGAFGTVCKVCRLQGESV